MSIALARGPVMLGVAGTELSTEDRERLGLWLAVAAVLAIGGVVAAVLVLSSLGIF